MAELAGARAPHDKIWVDLDRRFRAPLRSYFQRRLGDRSEAEDLTQEVFIRLARHPDRSNGDTIDAYIFKIASSVLQDCRRRRAVRCTDLHRELPNVSENAPCPAILTEERTPERVLEGKIALKEIENALAELSSRTREILLLSRLENVHHRDIAQMHGISVSAVEKHVLKAIAYLAAKVFRP
jgi:RNA polymerase sigma-70 factor (ECF subfamily)